MSATKRHLENLVEDLVVEALLRHPDKSREELEDGALAVVTCAPEADSIFDAPWVTEWQKKHSC